MTTWQPEDTPHFPLPNAAGWIRVILRAVPVIALILICFVLQQALRLIERPIFGAHRPLTPWFTVFVCRTALRILGIGYHQTGRPLTGNGALVANHSSWLDIFTLNAAAPLYFVSKAEVAGWPGIGWLARGTGTLFIARDRKHAAAHTQLLESRLLAGHKLLFFPEGTSTDGQQVLPFKSTLFQAFLSPQLKSEIAVQPVSLRYHAPADEDPRFYGWWGDMDLAPHLLHTLSARRQGHITVTYHPALIVADYPDRKSLAAAAEKAVRTGHMPEEPAKPIPEHPASTPA